MCKLCERGALPAAWINIFSPWCSSYDTPSYVRVEVCVQTGEEDVEVIYSHQADVGPFDDDAEIRRWIDADVMTALRMLRDWRQRT